MILKGQNQSTSRKTRPQATLSTVNVDLCGERPATNHLNQGMALIPHIMVFWVMTTCSLAGGYICS